MARCKNGFHKSRRKLDKGTCISKNTVKRKRCANGSRKVGSTCQPNGLKTKNSRPKLSPKLSPLREKEEEEEVLKADSFYDSDDDMTPAELAAKHRKPSPEPIMLSPPRELDPQKQNTTKVAKKKKGRSKSKQSKKTKKVVTKDGRIYKRGRRIKSKEKLWQPT